MPKSDKAVDSASLQGPSQGPSRVQSVFIDIVGFTKDRSVEAQSDVVATLNRVVTESVVSLQIDPNDVIFLPTGDGMAIALVDVKGLDLHLRLALELLRLTSAHNNTEKDESRRFDLRIGINENIDNVLTDINGRRNVAGDGISMAQRIMDQGDAGQILVGSTVFETLRHREKYLKAFRGYVAKAKHERQFSVYQFISEGIDGLQTTVPTAFKNKDVGEPKFSPIVASFIALAHFYRAAILKFPKRPIRNDAATLLLFHLAQDAVAESEAGEHETARKRALGPEKASFEDRYAIYVELPTIVILDLLKFVKQSYFLPYLHHFEVSECTFVKVSALNKLKSEYPHIAKSVNI